MENSQHHHFQDMAQLVMAHFVGQHRHQLVNGVSLDEGIEKDDASVAAEAGEKGVGFGRSPRPVHDLNIVQREADGAGIGQDGGFQRTVRQRLEAVEQGHDPFWGHKLNPDGEQADQQPAPQPGSPPGILEKEQDAGQKGNPEDQGDQKAFEAIRHPDGHGGLIESEARLDPESGIEIQRLVEKRLQPHHDADEDQSGGQWGPRQGPRPAIQHGETATPPESQQGQQIGNGHDLTEMKGAALIGQGLAVFLRFIKIPKGGGDRIGHGLEIEAVGQLVN
ncbi:hypothetical protein DESC_160003 [Desulfosarcina cetonica]|nr:hypothetical protein DESC_160003 [Desulfosarcina cetonica]